MNCRPSIDEVRQIAREGKYDVVPVSCEILSDFTTPIETMRILKNVSTHCYMLESAMANEKWGRYTFLGYDPIMEITCIDGEMKIGDLKVARYHSLAADPDTMPECLKVTALTADGEVMAVEHRDYPIYGVQFHPESILTPDGRTILKNFIGDGD